MKKDNPIRDKSYSFALSIVMTHKSLVAEKKEFVLSKQLLRSGTSIGANIEEAIGGQSNKDFFAKICVAYKEARETHFWLRLLRDSNILCNDKAVKLIIDCNELLRLLGSIQKTMRKNS